MNDPRFRIRTDCRACGSVKLDRAVKLDPLPLVSPNVGVAGEAAASAADVTVPADLYLCAECGLLQLTAAIDPGFQYNKFKYVTTISPGLPEHFQRSTDQILRIAALPPRGQVVEIGSNDGTLLRAFQERGWDVLGIDPAEKAAEIANARGVPTIVGFFNVVTARDIVLRTKTADLVIANNTLANIDNLDEVGKGLDIILGADGVFAFETSYGADVVRKLLLDTIYHEHLSYFMVVPLQRYFARHGFELFHVEEVATKGGSIRGFVQRAGGSRPVHGSVKAFIDRERNDGLSDIAAYRRMSAAIDDIKGKLGAVLDDALAQGERVAAYGASVGCVTLINQLGLASKLSCVFDDHPLLDTISGPNYSIPVVGSEEIELRRPKLIVVLAWRYADMIISKHAAFQAKGGRFVLPLPTVSLQ